MELLASLQSNHGHRTALGYDFHARFKELAERGEADVAIVSTEEGFSPLGASRDFFERDLDISYENEIKSLANWNRFDNERVTLVALASRRPGSLLRGIILAPGSNTRSYEPFARSHDPRPNRDFYYNISYEAIAFACREWGAQAGRLAPVFKRPVSRRYCDLPCRSAGKLLRRASRYRAGLLRILRLLHHT